MTGSLSTAKNRLIITCNCHRKNSSDIGEAGDEFSRLPLAGEVSCNTCQNAQISSRIITMTSFEPCACMKSTDVLAWSFPIACATGFFFIVTQPLKS